MRARLIYLAPAVPVSLWVLDSVFASLFVGDDLDVESYDHIHQIDPNDVMDYLHKNVEEAPRDVLSGIQDVAGV